MKKELLCITCPIGCRLTAELHEDGSVTVSGNECKRGISFAQGELTHPMRSLTTTVRTDFPGVPVIPVRIDGEIPKEDVFKVMHMLSGVKLTQRLGCGDTLPVDIPGSSCRIIVTSNVLKE